MTDADLSSRVREVIGRMSPLGSRPVESTDRLAEDLGYDSLAIIELSLQIESTFGLTSVDESDASDVSTVADIEDLVARTIASARAA